MTNVLPLVSVIVPAHNGVSMLTRCLRALAGTDYPSYEVIVVDDSSTEPIRALATAVGARYLRLDGGPFGPAHARNRGAQLARGDILFFTDADCEAHSGTIRRAVQRLTRHHADAVFGSYDDNPGDPGFLSQYKNLFHHYVHHDASPDATTFWSACGAIWRDTFLEIGGFDATQFARPSIEDIELGVRLRAAGKRIVLDKEMQVRHLKRWTLTGLIKTDVFDRGAPWTELILRTGVVPADLNLKPSERVNAALAIGGVATAAVGVLSSAVGSPRAALSAFASASLALGAFFYRTRPLYRYFAQRRGRRFAVQVAPMHVLYYHYSALSVIIGTVAFLRSRRTAAAPSRSTEPVAPT